MFNRSGEFWMCLTPKGKNDILALGSHAVSEGLLTRALSMWLFSIYLKETVVAFT